MDEVDFILSRRLLLDSRTSFADLAKDLGITAQAAHRRVQALIEEGMIRKFTAKVSVRALGADLVMLMGTAPPIREERVLKAIQAQGCTEALAQASGGQLFLVGMVRSVAEAGDYVMKVSEIVGMRSPTLGIMDADLIFGPRRETRPLNPTDLAIVAALADDSRRQLSSVAKEVGISAHTVRRRLQRMVDEGAIYFTMEWLPIAAAGIFANISVRLKDAGSRRRAFMTLATKYAKHSFSIFPFSNPPDLMIVWTWTRNMKDLNDLCASLSREDFAVSVQPHVLCDGAFMRTWRDDVVRNAGVKGRGPRGADKGQRFIP